MKPLAMLRAFQPVFRPASTRVAAQIPVLCNAFPKASPFSTSAALQARKKGRSSDSRITKIRYFLDHPKTPRPLRFSRLRALRHWTIHRAWMLFKKKRNLEKQMELERQYNSMYHACEALRDIDDRGLTTAEGGKNVGRLYRTAMLKTGVWNGIPIEYARPQTDTPSKDGWNHDWKR